MRFAEEFLLLLRAEDGTLSRAAEWLVRSALGAAVLMDLALENRIDTDADGLFLTDSTPVGDPLLDPMLAEIAGTEDTHNALYWVGSCHPACRRNSRNRFGAADRERHPAAEG